MCFISSINFFSQFSFSSVNFSIGYRASCDLLSFRLVLAHFSHKIKYEKDDLAILVTFYVLFSFKSLFSVGSGDLEIIFWDVGQGVPFLFPHRTERKL
jgi:hypothetical protein